MWMAVYICPILVIVAVLIVLLAFLPNDELRRRHGLDRAIDEASEDSANDEWMRSLHRVKRSRRQFSVLALSIAMALFGFVLGASLVIERWQGGR